MARSRRTPAVLISPMLLGAFQPAKPAPGGPPRSFPEGENQGLASTSLCSAATSHSPQPVHARFTLASSNLYLRVKCVVQQIPVLGLGGRKAPSSMGKISTAGVLRLRATSAVSRDKSVRRSAQDDGFVGGRKGLKYSWLDMQKTRKDRKSHSLSG